RHFVSLSKSWIVEYRIAEILDRAAVSQHGLPDMDNLGSALTDRMYAKQLARISVEQQLQHAGFVAEHHALRQLGVLRDSYFVRHAIFRQPFFVQSHHRNFGNRINAVREKV